MMFRSTDPMLLFLAGAAVGAMMSAVLTNEYLSGQLKRKLLVSYKRLSASSNHSLLQNRSEENNRDCDMLTLHRMLDVIERDMIPLTCHAVCTGKQLNRCDGAAVLRTSDMNLILVTTNQESRCHLYHAAIIAIEEFCEMSHKKRLASLASECTIILTFKPCQTCRRALAASGFGEAFYLFDKDDFPGVESMSCMCTSWGGENETVDFNCSSISSQLRIYETKRRNERAALQEDIAGNSSSPMTAKDMAEAAAADNLMVRVGRRIDQLKHVYIRINGERQSDDVRSIRDSVQ